VRTLLVSSIFLALTFASAYEPNTFDSRLPKLSTARSTAPAPQSRDQSTADFLPLHLGNKWTLRNAKSGKQIVLTVESAHDGVETVKFQNPWMTSSFIFEQHGGAYVLKALRILGLEAPMPPDTVYFDFTAPQGASWQNKIGTIRVAATGATFGAYFNCIQFVETNKQGHKNYWTFAPGKGFVQFGQGQDAFVLDEASSSIQTSSAAPPPQPAPIPIASGAPRQGWVGTRIALANNTAANEWLTPWAVNKRFHQAVTAGVNYVYLSPKWQDLEPSPGKYVFKDIDFQVKQAEDANLPLVLNLRVIDTANRPIPSDLRDLSFADPRMIERLDRLIDEITPHLKGRLAYLLIGNEVDAYFRARPAEITPYLTLFSAAKLHARTRLNQVATSLTITIDGLPETSGALRPLIDAGDFFSITYYPLDANFKVKDPSVVNSDVEKILRAAGNKQVLFQEFGYPSSEKNGSSQEKQARFVANFLDAVSHHQGRIIGANLLFMCDFSNSVTADLAKSYNMPNAERFSAFLQTLGLFDGNGVPKKSWAVFSKKVSEVTRAR
jgi:hypothetical protein